MITFLIAITFILLAVCIWLTIQLYQARQVRRFGEKVANKWIYYKGRKEDIERINKGFKERPEDRQGSKAKV